MNPCHFESLASEVFVQVFIKGYIKYEISSFNGLFKVIHQLLQKGE